LHRFNLDGLISNIGRAAAWGVEFPLEGRIPKPTPSPSGALHQTAAWFDNCADVTFGQSGATSATAYLAQAKAAGIKGLVQESNELISFTYRDLNAQLHETHSTGRAA